MVFDGNFIRFSLLLILLHYVEGEGTLYISLERYQNDTCGGYEQTNTECVYHVTLRIQSYITRGGDLVQDSEHYRLLQFSSKHYLLKFYDISSLGPLPNPIPIKFIKGSVNFTFAVNNDIGRIFQTTHTFNPGLMQPGKDMSFYSDYNKTGILVFSTKLTCAQHYTGDGCKECEDNWHGSSCEVWCEPSKNYTCNSDTGRKVCRENLYGEDCSKYCVNTTNYSCTEHGNKICSYPAIGTECKANSSCPEHQYGTGCNVTCYHHPGQYLCGEDGSRVCEGYFTGPDCSTCTEHHYGANCNITCNARAPRYTCSIAGERVCSAGWEGVQCEHCGDSWFGEQCNVMCNTSSKRYTCTNSGRKVCNTNIEGRECEKCSKDYYGPLCQVHCTTSWEDPWKCDEKTGEKVCKRKRTGKDCLSCVEENYYPVNETADCIECPVSDRYTCSEWGEKVCNPTWYTAECNVQCNSTARYTCTSNGDKQCTSSKFAGQDCAGCIDDHYGEGCEVECYKTLISGCDPETGALKCKENYFTVPAINNTDQTFCGHFCNVTSLHYTCDAGGNKLCNVNRDPDTECDSCVTGWYGSECNTHCYTSHPNMRCNNTGSLVCKQGFTGQLCEECDENYYNWLCTDEEAEQGVCSRTCDMYCVDMYNYKCGSDGVLEISQDLLSEYYQEEGAVVKIAGLISGFFLLYLLATAVLYYLCFVRYPYPPSCVK